MAIGTDAAIEFFGTQDSLDSTSGSVADGAFSVAGDLDPFTNTDDAKFGNAVIEFTCSVAPDAGSSISLYFAPQNIVSTNDQLAPTANFKHQFIGVFPVKDVTTAQFVSIDFSFINTVTSQEYQPYIESNTGQTIGSGWDVHITAKAIGPHA